MSAEFCNCAILTHRVFTTSFSLYSSLSGLLCQLDGEKTLELCEVVFIVSIFDSMVLKVFSLSIIYLFAPILISSIPLPSLAIDFFPVLF